MAILTQLTIMNHPLLRLATLVLLLGTVACERPIQLAWETTEGAPVLLGVIEPGHPLELQLVRSTHPLDTLGFPPIEGAVVRLFHAGNPITLQTLGDGLYTTPPTWNAYPGIEYQCEVLTPQGENLTVQGVTIPARPIIDAWQYDKDGYQASGISTTRDLLTLELSSPQDSIAYYEIDLFGIKEIGETEPITAFRIGSDESFDAACGFGNQIISNRCNSSESLELQWAVSAEYTETDSLQGRSPLTYDSLLVVVSSLSEALYRYKMSLMSDELSSVFFYTDSVYSNIQGGEGILGARNPRSFLIAL